MITVEHLTKYYGDFLAVDDLSFEIGEGHVYGFLGPNGAGKTTTMNMMTGCLAATAGHVRVDGFDLFDAPLQAKGRMGYLPEQPPLYLGETPEEYLRFVGRAKGLKGQALEEQLARVMEQTRIAPVGGRLISALSKGYRQRVGIAQALLGDPQVIILDEPTVGLDPIQIVEIRELIRQLGRDRTVLFSSHILSEVQAICDRILIINRGRLVAFDTPEGLERRLLAPGQVTLTADGSVETVRDILAQVEHAQLLELRGADGVVTARLRTDLPDIHNLSRSLFFAFAARDTALLELSLKKTDLEDIFLELTELPDEPAQEARQPDEKEDPS